MAKAPQVIENAHNQLIHGTVLQGDLICSGNLKVDGKVVGNIISPNRVVVGETGIVEGEMKCQNAQVYGDVNGFINCEDVLVLKSTAKIKGDIKTGKMVIEIGAFFTGNCSMSSGETT
ncbi:MAG: polymer-forming cytoskeletal protein [Bacteroidales bacterium]|jgi:cytoskeletal protein CcmA (bactofilin family)|nr:polymer-forming cytoskeletal protein [Bacteroidales bacterium]